jgi:hypothetical protein
VGECALVADPDDFVEHEFFRGEVDVQGGRAQPDSRGDVPGGGRVKTVGGEAADRRRQQPTGDVPELVAPQLGRVVLQPGVVLQLLRREAGLPFRHAETSLPALRGRS